MTFDPSTPPAERREPSRDLRRFRRHHHHHVHGLFPGLVLVLWGGLLLLRELGYLSPSLHFMDFWPVLLVALGLERALRPRIGSIVVGLAIAALGAGLLAERLGFALGLAHYWPVLLIAAGIGVLFGGLSHRRSHGRLDEERVSGDELRRTVSMGGLAMSIDSQQFKGGSLGVTMGEVQVDLRRAAMAGEEAALDLSLTMGGVELLVPTHWQVVDDISPFIGAVEDKTDPRPDAAGVQRKLVLHGTITMGAVTIRN
jgi:predicted membrane protein